MASLKTRALASRLQKPPRLREGDTIRIIAPASPPLTPDVFERAVTAFTQRGYSVEIGTAARNHVGFLAGTDKERTADLNRALSAKRVRAVVPIRGGYGTGRILNSVKFDQLERTPKILLGGSDITALMTAVTIESKLVTFHAPMPQSLVDPDCPDYNWDHLFAVLGGNIPSSLVAGYPERDSTIVCIKKGRATGRLIGGNLAVFCSLLGSTYVPSLRNAIFFFEDIGETPFRIDRLLTQLLNAGLLQQAAGFALGLFKNCEYLPSDSPKQSLTEVIHERLAPLGKPIVMGLPFGHTRYNATLPIGVRATVDATRGDLFFEEDAVT